MVLSEIRDTPMFRGLSEEETVCALTVLQSAQRRYKKGAVLMHAGGRAAYMGLVLSGSVTIESTDAWGSRSILNHVGQLQLFAETYALLHDAPLLVDVVANEMSCVLFLYVKGIQASQPWGLKLMSNLLHISSMKNLHLSSRSFHTAPKTVRGRVMAYLNTVSLQEKSAEFDIPFDRQQLADYLNVERTALSKELGKMQADGLIETKKSHFILC